MNGLTGVQFLQALYFMVGTIIFVCIVVLAVSAIRSRKGR